MVAKSVIIDPLTKNKAMVTEFGQLVVAPIAYSAPVTAEMDTADTPYLLISPVANKGIVITTIILTANRNVGINDATVTLYTSDVADGVIPANPEVKLEMIKSSTLPLSGLNLFVPEGRFIIAQTDDATVFVTLGFYRVPINRVIV
jgi:hypothetical protein